jgi:hypothetical protein
MMPETYFERTVLIFAGVIVPQLENNSALQKPFLDNFEKLMNGIDPDSFDKIKLLVKVIGILSWVYNLKSFKTLNRDQKERFVEKLFHFPISMLVAGLTGLRSLVFIAYYGIPAVWKDINYDGPIVSNDI